MRLLSKAPAVGQEPSTRKCSSAQRQSSANNQRGSVLPAVSYIANIAETGTNIDLTLHGLDSGGGRRERKTKKDTGSRGRGAPALMVGNPDYGLESNCTRNQVFTH